MAMPLVEEILEPMLLEERIDYDMIKQSDIVSRELDYMPPTSGTTIKPTEKVSFKLKYPGFIDPQIRVSFRLRYYDDTGTITAPTTRGIRTVSDVVSRIVLKCGQNTIQDLPKWWALQELIKDQNIPYISQATQFHITEGMYNAHETNVFAGDVRPASQSGRLLRSDVDYSFVIPTGIFGSLPYIPQLYMFPLELEIYMSTIAEAVYHVDDGPNINPGFETYDWKLYYEKVSRPKEIVDIVSDALKNDRLVIPFQGYSISEHNINSGSTTFTPKISAKHTSIRSVLLFIFKTENRADVTKPKHFVCPAVKNIVFKNNGMLYPSYTITSKTEQHVQYLKAMGCYQTGITGGTTYKGTFSTGVVNGFSFDRENHPKLRSGQDTRANHSDIQAEVTFDSALSGAHSCVIVTIYDAQLKIHADGTTLVED